MAKDPHANAEKIYLEILDRLEELAAVYAEISGQDEEEDEGDKRQLEDILEAVVGEAGERGLDEDGADKLFKAMSAFAQKASEI